MRWLVLGGRRGDIFGSHRCAKTCGRGCVSSFPYTLPTSSQRVDKVVIGPVGSSHQDTHETEDRVATKDCNRDIPSHIALFMPSLGGGGVERVMLNLAG